MQDRRNIVALLERASGRDPALDIEISRFLRLPDRNGVFIPKDAWVHPDSASGKWSCTYWLTHERSGGVESYTSSIDAALMLMARMLPGWDFSLDRTEECLYSAVSPPGSEDWTVEVNGPTAPLAILKGILKALETMEAQVGCLVH